VKAYPFNFDNPKGLIESLTGASVLYNTYWVRFNRRDFGYAKAVENSLKLFEAAKKAGIKRVVHTSITNPSENSPFDYFRYKAKVERALVESSLSYCILRPAVLFGDEGILINNIAWFIRKFPVFGVFGDGNYRLQPIYVDDFAKLAVEQGQKKENRIIDAIGPETFTYRGLVEELAATIGKRRTIISIPPTIGYLVGWLVGKIVGDVPVTIDEIKGLMAELLYVHSPSVGETKLTDWAKNNASTLGMHYFSELARWRERGQNK
jgi:NADH dehydrogenase